MSGKQNLQRSRKHEFPFGLFILIVSGFLLFVALGKTALDHRNDPWNNPIAGVLGNLHEEFMEMRFRHR